MAYTICDFLDQRKGLVVNSDGSINVALSAGTALLGKVGIDQVTANANEVVTKTGSITTATLGAGSALVGNVGHGKTIKFVTATVAANTDIVAAVPGKRIKVIAYKLTSVSATANTITFQSNAVTALDTTIVQASAGVTNGVVEAIAAPSFLFATVAGEKLTLAVSAAVNVTYRLTYFDDDAT